MPAIQVLREAVRSLQKIGDVFPAAADAASRIESCRIELRDVSDTLESLQEGIDASPEALQQTEGRLALLYDLMRRNDVDTVEALIEVRDQYAAELESADDLVQREEQLKADADAADMECSRLCAMLTESRKAVTEALSGHLQEDIRQLDIPQGQFRVELVPLGRRTRSGAENAQFLFSSTASAAPADLKQHASGGELSRIMLCIKAMLARHKALPTVIFDEIDTGTSGSLADKIGSKIVEISENIQVIAITHLPQVAAKGGAHYLVYKEYTDSGAKSCIRLLQGTDRVREIARMISGSSVTAEAEAAARVLLNQSDKLF
jgi:DNA repair protein RecN (Recombination protein N)